MRGQTGVTCSFQMHNGRKSVKEVLPLVAEHSLATWPHEGVESRGR